jgi:hypothetical protein
MRGKSGHWLWLFAFTPAVLNFSSIALELAAPNHTPPGVVTP